MYRNGAGLTRFLGSCFRLDQKDRTIRALLDITGPQLCQLTGSRGGVSAKPTYPPPRHRTGITTLRPRTNPHRPPCAPDGGRLARRERLPCFPFCYLSGDLAPSAL